MKRQFAIYHIERGYRSVTVWQGGRMTGARIGVHECRPYRTLSREDRHKCIAHFLNHNFGIPAPIYRPKDTSK